MPSSGESSQDHPGVRSPHPTQSPGRRKVTHCPGCAHEITSDALFCPWCVVYIPAPDRGRKAGLFVRWVALMLDPGIGVLLCLAAIFGLGALSQPLGVLTAVLLPGGYLAWFLSLLRQGRSPGKKLLGLHVVEAQSGEIPGFGKMFLREIPGRMLSGLVLGLGFVRAFYDRSGQAWHDKLAETVVLEATRRA